MSVPRAPNPSMQPAPRRDQDRAPKGGPRLVVVSSPLRDGSLLDGSVTDAGQGDVEGLAVDAAQLADLASGADENSALESLAAPPALEDLGRPVVDRRGVDGALDAANVGLDLEWRIHDRTHVEVALDMPIDAQTRAYRWEAYFFVPESFRLDEASYDRAAIYEDFRSYVRLAVPTHALQALAAITPGSPLFLLRARLTEAIGALPNSPASELAIRHARLFACRVRAACMADTRAIAADAASADDLVRAGVRADTAAFIASCRSTVLAMRKVFAELADAPLPEDVGVAVRWTDEDLSLAIESTCASLGLALASRHHKPLNEGETRDTDAAIDPFAGVPSTLATLAAAEARHRARSGYVSVLSSDASVRALEAFAWRRHVLKRFTASVLWLSLEVRDGAGWVRELLYAVAAALAMALGLVATLNAQHDSLHLVSYALIVIAGYVVRDRSKAMFEKRFSRWARKRYPDRRWTIRDGERARDLGEVHERAGFLGWSGLPRGVVALRRTTREHAMEEQARPERVLWHQKRFVIEPLAGTGDLAAPMLTEIFRLNLEPWLAHTGDFKQRVTFADASDGNVYAASARRVYNISIVYRLALEGAGGVDDTTSPWHRLRLVVSRKGVERLEPIA